MPQAVAPHISERNHRGAPARFWRATSQADAIIESARTPVRTRRVVPLWIASWVLVASCGGYPRGPASPARGASTPFQPNLAASPAETAPPVTPAPGGLVDPASETTRLQFDLNRLRRSQGLEEWTSPAALQQIALARALELASRGGLSHTRLAETTAAVLTMLEAEGYAGRMAELLIRVRDPGEGLAATVLRAWFEDEAHRADILSPDYYASGIGIAAGGGEWVVVLVLAEFASSGEVEP